MSGLTSPVMTVSCLQGLDDGAVNPDTNFEDVADEAAGKRCERCTMDDV